MQARLGEIIRRTIARGGSVLLPSFAVGRAQALLLVLQRLRAAGDIPHSLPIYLDSPMAIAATELTLKHRKLLRVAPREVATLKDGVRFIETGAQSQRLVALALSERHHLGQRHGHRRARAASPEVAGAR